MKMLLYYPCKYINTNDFRQSNFRVETINDEITQGTKIIK